MFAVIVTVTVMGGVRGGKYWQDQAQACHSTQVSAELEPEPEGEAKVRIHFTLTRNHLFIFEYLVDP
jgi:hypothetical protein